jgi:hypothetical protein
MNQNPATIPRPALEHRILTIRGDRVILDNDLAELYGVSTKRLNEQVKRNASRFPSDFAFLLTPQEKAEVVANCDHLAHLKFSPVLPRAFTEHGAIMAANVLNSAAIHQNHAFSRRASPAEDNQQKKRKRHLPADGRRWTQMQNSQLSFLR